MRAYLLGAFGACVFTLVTTSANASLVSRLGGQAVYDTHLNITWTADANLGASNSFGLTYGANLGPHPSDSSGNAGIIYSTGRMNWSGALFWIDAMNAANYLGFNDWRLPATLNPDASCATPSSSMGLNCRGSELGHLYYDDLGGTAGTQILTTGNSVELARFSNLDYNALYWSGTEVNSSDAWFFDTGFGGQNTVSKLSDAPFVWAVRTGDVSVVPVPAAVWLFGSGLLGLIGVTRTNTA